MPNRDSRKEYTISKLSEADVLSSPFEQFALWYEQAQQADLVEPNAFILSTASKDGMPSARVVLLKEFNGREFVFFTNYLSRKGRELADNPNVCMTFYWDKLERQVRIEGQAQKVVRAKSLEYFASRPRGAQIAAAASAQSSPITQTQLESRIAEIDRQYSKRDVLCPEHWGGYAIKPTVLEFWQGRENRLHDRIEYRLNTDGAWIIQRLSP